MPYLTDVGLFRTELLEWLIMLSIIVSLLLDRVDLD